MESLQQLIEELCPNGVEFKKLKEIVGIDRGVRVVRKDLQDNGFPVYQNSLKPLGYLSKSNVKANTPFIIVGGGAGSIGWSDIDFWAADDCVYFTCDETIDSRFLYHLLLRSRIFFISKVRKASVPRLARSVIEDFEIPVPPIAVQEKIVEILDKFTALTAELQAELQARQQQYEYYRNRLLSFGGSDNIHLDDADGISRAANGSADERNVILFNTCKLYKLKDIGTIKRGKRLTKKELSTEGKYPVFHGGINPIGFYHEYNRLGESIMIINVGASAGTIGYSDKPFWSSDGCFTISHEDNVMQKFLYYYLQSNQHYFQGKVRVGGIPTLDNKVVEEFILPIPPLSEQQRIVDILDKFESMTSDLASGLPAEIEARQKQYEYYRNKLLQFERLEA